jgi:hypothetical protein
MSYTGNDPAGSFVRIMNALLLVRMLKGIFTTRPPGGAKPQLKKGLRRVGSGEGGATWALCLISNPNV